MLCGSPYLLGRKGLLPENGDEKGDSDQYLVRTNIEIERGRNGIDSPFLFLSV